MHRTCHRRLCSCRTCSPGRAFPTGPTEFGPGANAWTNDEDEQSRLIRDLAAGMVFISGNVTSYPHLPFGGVKNSGHGRELSVQGIHEFCNIKSMWIGQPGRS